MLKTTHKLIIISFQLYAKTPMHALYKFRHMAEASSIKNIDVCIIAENEINTLQKKLPPSL